VKVYCDFSDDKKSYTNLSDWFSQIGFTRIADSNFTAGIARTSFSQKNVHGQLEFLHLLGICKFSINLIL